MTFEDFAIYKTVFFMYEIVHSVGLSETIFISWPRNSHRFIKGGNCI